MGIIYLSSEEPLPGTVFDERSGKGSASVIPDEIKKLNWGAAGVTIIWGIYHRVWISLLFLIPIVDIVIMILLLIKGNEMAWRKKEWESVDKFLAFQKKWKIVGIIFLILNSFYIVASVFWAIAVFAAMVI
jgi:hypothetical protein